MSPLTILTVMLSFLTLYLTHTHANTIPNSGLFNITNFINTGSPHTLSTRISFRVSSSSCPGSAPLNNVECFYQQSVQPTIATTTLPVPCYDHSVSFDFSYASGSGGSGAGYFLSVAHVYNGNKTVDAGGVYMGHNVETVVDPLNPNGNYQRLVHEPDFGLGFNRVEGCC